MGSIAGDSRGQALKAAEEGRGRNKENEQRTNATGLEVRGKQVRGSS